MKSRRTPVWLSLSELRWLATHAGPLLKERAQLACKSAQKSDMQRSVTAVNATSADPFEAQLNCFGYTLFDLTREQLEDFASFLDAQESADASLRPSVCVLHEQGGA